MLDRLIDKLKLYSKILHDAFLVALLRSGEEIVIEKIKNPILHAEARIIQGEQVTQIPQVPLAEITRSPILTSSYLIIASKTLNEYKLAKLYREIARYMESETLHDLALVVIAYTNSKKLYNVLWNVALREENTMLYEFLVRIYDSITFRFSIDYKTDICIEDAKRALMRSKSIYAKNILASILLAFYSKDTEAKKYFEAISSYLEEKELSLEERAALPIVFKNMYMFKPSIAQKLLAKIKNLTDDLIEMILMIPLMTFPFNQRISSRLAYLQLTELNLIYALLALGRSKRFKALKTITRTTKDIFSITEDALLASAMIRFLIRMKQYEEAKELFESIYQGSQYIGEDTFAFDIGTIYTYPYTGEFKETLNTYAERLKDPKLLEAFVYGAYDESLKSYPLKATHTF